MLAAVAGALAAAGPATADDASVERAWDAYDARYMELGQRFARAVKRWRASGLRRPGGVIRVSRATRRLLGRTRSAVAGEQASSPTGERARRYALLSIDSFELSFRVLEKGLRLGARAIRVSAANRRRGVRIARRADRHLRRSDRVYARSYRQARRGKELFRQAERERGQPAPDPGTNPEPPAPPQPPSPLPCLLPPLC